MLLLFVPVRVKIWVNGKLERIRLRYGFLAFDVYGGKSKKQKSEKPKKPAQPKEKKKKSKKKLTSISDAIAFAKEAIPQLVRAIRIFDFHGELVVGNENPAKTGMYYGAASAAGGILLPLLENHLNIRREEIEIRADFSAQKTVVSLFCHAKVLPFRVLILAIKLLPKLPITSKD